jgi:pimeloyl-ACP methyl ester carboxylesterase
MLDGAHGSGAVTLVASLILPRPTHSPEIMMARSQLRRRGSIVFALIGLPWGCAPPAQPTTDTAETPPVPSFTVEEVSFSHGTDRLAGVLSRPNTPGPHPAVILILGSGAEDRDYGGVGPALREHFARHDVACLAWDKPGVSRSTGDYMTQTFRNRADEVLAAVRFLRGRTDIRADRVGVWGHSQGGMIAPLAASLAGDFAFLIEVSGWQGPAWKQDIMRVESELRAARFSEDDVREGTAFARARMNLIRGTGPFEELDKAQARVEARP